MTEREYRQHEGISRSALWKLRESPEKAKYAWEHPEPPTPALLFGQAVHKLLLQPETFYQEFVVAPNGLRRTAKKGWAEFAGLNPTLTAITEDEFDKASLMVQKCMSHPIASALLNGEHEKPFFWTDEITGEKCKMRADSTREVKSYPMCVDYKTADSAETSAFIRSAIKYGYHVQTAMYLDGIAHNILKTSLLEMLQNNEAPMWGFIVQEKDPPFAVNVIASDTPSNTEFIKFVKFGYDQGSSSRSNSHDYRELLGIYHDCKTSGNWYGYLGAYNIINNLALPSWAAKELDQ